MTSTITIATFENAGEAEILRQELAECGIGAWLANDATSVALWHVGSALGGVGVQINAHDKPIAQKVIAERQRRRERNLQAADWYCGQCREWISPSFDICWSCRGARNDVQVVGKPVPDTSNDGALGKTANQPARAEKLEAEAEAVVDRAWRASVLGWAVCPPILLPPLVHVYSTWISSRIEIDTIGQPARKKLGYTMLLNWLAFAVFAIVFVSFVWSVSRVDPLDNNHDWLALPQKAAP